MKRAYWMIFASCLALLMAVPVHAMRDPGIGGPHGSRGVYGGAGAAPVPGQGYHDGMNLYGGYFAALGGRDPMGTATILDTTVTSGMPFVHMDLEADGPDGLGATFVCARLLADCECTEVRGENKGYSLRNITLEVRFIVALDPARINNAVQANNPPGVSAAQVYGHEQRHVEVYKAAFSDPTVTDRLHRVMRRIERETPNWDLESCRQNRCGIPNDIRRRIGIIVSDYGLHTDDRDGRRHFAEGRQPDGPDDDQNNNGIDDDWEQVVHPNPGGQNGLYPPIGNVPNSDSDPLRHLGFGFLDSDDCWHCWSPPSLRGIVRGVQRATRLWR